MNIEDLIKQKRDELDLETPPSDLWNDIHKDWKTKKESFPWWKVAAIIFITFSVGLLINNVLLRQQVDELASLSDISNEYEVIEKGYITQINQLETSLPLEEISANEDLKWLAEELSMLDEVNTIYRKDIGIVNEDQLVEVLIDYYEKKIRLLKKLELEIKRLNKFNENEKTNTDNINI